MTTWQAIVLGILQGITEFLPVSSSGHLVIFRYLLGGTDPGMVFDTLVHLATLIAVLAHFWGDLWRLFRAALEALRRRSLADPEARIAWSLVVGTIPAAVVGVLLEDTFERLFGMPRAAAGFLLVTATLIVVSEVLGRRTRSISAVSWLDALGIGIAQSFAVAPGLSRSGSTIAAGLLFGFRREDATRYSFLLSVPIVLGGGLYQAFKLLTGRIELTMGIGALLLGFLAAMITGYLAIAGLLALVRRHSLWPFAVYTATLAILVLTGVLGG